MADAFIVKQVTQRLLADKYGRWKIIFGEDLLTRVVERIADEWKLQTDEWKLQTDELPEEYVTSGLKQTVSGPINANGLRP